MRIQQSGGLGRTLIVVPASMVMYLAAALVVWGISQVIDNPLVMLLGGLAVIYLLARRVMQLLSRLDGTDSS